MVLFVSGTPPPPGETRKIWENCPKFLENPGKSGKICPPNSGSLHTPEIRSFLSIFRPKVSCLGGNTQSAQICKTGKPATPKTLIFTGFCTPVLAPNRSFLPQFLQFLQFWAPGAGGGPPRRKIVQKSDIFREKSTLKAYFEC